LQYRELGSTGERLSILGFGCMRLPTIGGDEAWIDEKAATALLHEAIERGVNLVDNAYTYHHGNSELWLAKALQGGFREKVILSTKLPSWKIEKREDFDRYLNEQLERLETDRFDIYLVHSLKKSWWEKVRDLGVIEFLEGAKRDGRIRFAGFSFHDEFEVFKDIVDANRWDCCLMQYNYMDVDNQAGTQGLRYAAAQRLGVLVMEPLHGGNLAGQLPQDVREIWQRAGDSLTPAQWALRWVWNHREVVSALSGMNAMEQLEENLAAAEGAEPDSLSSENLAMIDSVREKFLERKEIPCTACDYCLPCPQGVGIPKIFAIYNTLKILGGRGHALYYYNNSLEPEERADNCIECGECEEKCPQRIEIIDQIKKIHQELYKGKP